MGWREVRQRAGKMHTGTKAEGNGRVNNTIKQNKVTRPLPLSEYHI